MKRRILFLSHSASRNGASVLLLQFLRWMREHTDYQLDVLCISGGPLLGEYRDVARTRMLRNPAVIFRWLPFRWTRALQAKTQDLALWFSLLGRKPDLIYANTTAAWRQVIALQGRAAPVLWHIHEMSYAMQVLLGDQNPAQVFNSTNRFIAVSRSVVKALTTHCAVPLENIDLVNGFSAAKICGSDERRSKRSEILSSLGWDESCFVVGACGEMEWRKGADLFLQIARDCIARDDFPRLRFLWVGGSPDNVEAIRFAHDVQALGLRDVCRHVASTANVHDYYCAMNVFALPSREDPYPIVVLEAGLHGLPTVCFEDAGGAAEFVGTDAGIVVPYMALRQFAEAVQGLSTAPARLAKMGEVAERKARLTNSLERQAPMILGCIERCMASGSPAATGAMR